jgi:hypothetical protein
MNPSRSGTWSLLGSNLWLRSLRTRDLPRAKAFLSRSDLLRSAPGTTGADLLPTGERRWLATDVWGAPACFLALEASSGGAARLRFAVPAAEGLHLREGLRLLIDGLRRHSSLEQLAVQPPDDLQAQGTLRELGWREGSRGIWVLDLHPAPGVEAPTHAG